MDTFQFSLEFSELVKSKRSDSLFDILVKLQSQKVCNFVYFFWFCSHFIKIEMSPVEQSNLVLDVGIQLSEILCSGFLSGGTFVICT